MVPALRGRRPPLPAEDCGGHPGYVHLREVLADPEHDEHADTLEWLELQAAAQFDPAAFDVDEVNAAL